MSKDILALPAEDKLTTVSQFALSQIEPLIMHGDLSKLNQEQRMQYYRYRCESLQLDPLSRPFDWLTLNGKLVLYPNRGGVEQVRRNNKVSVTVTDKKTEDGLFTVYVRAMTPDGRVEDECGSVPIDGMKGEKLANAQMKAMTKAKRRATISICGLGMPDETEIDSIPNAHRATEFTGLQPRETAFPPAPKIVQSKTEPETFPWENQAPQSIAAVIPAVMPMSLAEQAVGFGKHADVKFKDKPKEFWLEYVGQVKAVLNDLSMDDFEKANALIDRIETYLAEE